MTVNTLHWVDGDTPVSGFCRMVEQTLLPTEFVELDVKTVPDMVDAIWRLAVRGAPAIGVAAGYGMLLGVQGQEGREREDLMGFIKETAATLAKAVAAHPTHRLYDQVAPMAEELAERWSRWDGPRDLPERIIHGDLKISNVRFDGHEAVALIDLDTFQRGQLDAELGDAMRSWCNRSGEDVTEARVDTEVFAAAMAGYASTAVHTTDDEWLGMAPGLERIATELAMRFAADALNESYFGFDPAIGRGEHNLIRARGQLALARAAQQARPALDAAVASARAGAR